MTPAALASSPLGAGTTQWLMDADDFQLSAILKAQKAADVAAFIQFATRHLELHATLARILRRYRLNYLTGHISRIQLENAFRVCGLAPIAFGPERARVRTWHSEPFQRQAA